MNSGPVVGRDAGQGGERHHVAGIVEHVELPEVLGLGAVIALGLHIDLPLAAEAVEVIDERAAHEALHRLVDVLQLDALLQHLVAVHVHEYLRHRRQRGGEHAGEFGALFRRCQELLQVLGQEVVVPCPSGPPG